MFPAEPEFGAKSLRTIARRVLATELSALTPFALALPVLSALPGLASAQSSVGTLVAKPVSLPEMALGSPSAPITIVEFSSLTCSHCAAFAENVFPMLQTKYIDTGKVRFVSREFPLEIKAAGASMLARCAASGDAARYFEATTMLFKQQEALIEHTTETLKAVGGQFGMSGDAVEACVKDQRLLDKLTADQKFAYDKLKVDATPTFFINGTRVKGGMSFEELEARLTRLRKH
jgi:protein-disulfide isomerase